MLVVVSSSLVLALSWLCRNILVLFFPLSCCKVFRDKVNDCCNILAVHYVPIPCCEFVATFLRCDLLKSLTKFQNVATYFSFLIMLAFELYVAT